MQLHSARIRPLGRPLAARPSVAAPAAARAARHPSLPMRPGPLLPSRASNSDDITSGELDAIMRKYGGGSAGGAEGGSSGAPAKRSGGSGKPAPARRPAPSGAAPVAAPAGNGVFLLLLANIGLFLADHVFRLPGVQALYLNHLHPQWYQWVTHAFCHANFAHLSTNLFNLVVFGKLVEETEGAFGVVFTYIACALGAAAFSVLTQPAVVKGGAVAVSLGASGAIFGLFAVSVLARLSWDPRRLLESLILGAWVVRQVIQEAQAQVAGGLTIGGLAVGHLAHLGGALAGVLLVLALKALPDPGPDA